MDDSVGNPLESTGTPLLKGTRRFSMNAGRTTKQGQQISSGKDSDDYKATVGTMHMHPDDMKEIGVPDRKHRARAVSVGRGDVQVRRRQDSRRA